MENCTTVSTVEKRDFFKIELIFGDYQRKLPISVSEMENVYNYVFYPQQIFGLRYEATQNKKTNRRIFIMRACSPGELGSVAPGVHPGAEILVKTLSSAVAMRLNAILQKLIKNHVDLSLLPISFYARLNHLLEIKSNTDFCVGELLAYHQKI